MPGIHTNSATRAVPCDASSFAPGTVIDIPSDKAESQKEQERKFQERMASAEPQQTTVGRAARVAETGIKAAFSTATNFIKSLIKSGFEKISRIYTSTSQSDPSIIKDQKISLWVIGASIGLHTIKELFNFLTGKNKANSPPALLKLAEIGTGLATMLPIYGNLTGKGGFGSMKSAINGGLIHVLLTAFNSVFKPQSLVSRITGFGGSGGATALRGMGEAFGLGGESNDLPNMTSNMPKAF